MEVVDRLILDTLLTLDESFFDSFSSRPETINELSTSQIYEAVVLLLWACDPSSRSAVPSAKFPHTMTARYRAATSVAAAIKSVGVRDEVGYQTLLYGNTKEMRNVIIGLIEKLPKESPVIVPEKSPLKNLVESVLTTASEESNSSVLDKYSFYQRLTWKPSWGMARQLSFTGFDGDIAAASNCARFTDRCRILLCSALEANSHPPGSFASHAATKKALDFELSSLSQKRNISQKPSVPIKPKPSLPPKPTNLTQRDVQKEEKAKEMETTVTKLSTVVGEIDTLRSALDQLKKEVLQKEKECAVEKAMLEDLKVQEANIDTRLRTLMAEPEAFNKISVFVEGSEERMEDLQNRWITAKAEKEKAIKNAREACNSTAGVETLRTQIQEMLALAKETEAQFEHKQAHLLKLKHEVEKMESVPLNRSAYTKRIFDVVANIRKQQEDIDKVLSANRQLQKEIKSLEGKLDRTFTVVEERLYKDTQKDASMQKAYRLLVKIHEECSWVVSAIETNGRLNREIDELNDQIALQQQKGLDETLEKLLNDWMDVKQENTSLQRLLEP